MASPSPESAARVFFEEDADPRALEGLSIAVLGYGNQGRAQALNLRDSGHAVTVGNRADASLAQAREDGFRATDLREATAGADVVLVLLPDEEIPAAFRAEIGPALRPGAALVFASGYAIVSGQLAAPAGHDVLLIAPRMIGAGVRERFVRGEGFHCLVGVEQDASGRAFARVLALARAIGGLRKGAVRVTFREEVQLDLFSEQAFGPALGQVLLSAVEVLVEKGIPREAALLEIYLSGEVAHSMAKLAEVGLVDSLELHSRTSQYGALTRGSRFRRLGIKERMAGIYDEIARGDFFREWGSRASRLKLGVLKFFARRLPVLRWEAAARAALRIGIPRPAPVKQPEKCPAARE